jgi:xanthine/uracil/vitamin C permease (AzgA family)
MTLLLERLFKLSKHGSTFKKKLVAGLTTFQTGLSEAALYFWGQ